MIEAEEAEFEELESGDERALEAREAEFDLTEDDSLPWLESDEDESAGGFDMVQFAGFFALLLALLAAMVGGIWFLSNQTADPEVVADGSTIEAPEGPYKVKPENPGGKEFDGTGNVAPAVGEGQTREGRLAENGEGEGDADKSTEVPKPSIDTRKTDEAAASASASSSAASGSGVGVQVGAYGSRTRAEQGWAELTRSSAALEGVRYRIVKGQADIGTVYRLQALASDRKSADALCAALKNDGLPCQVKP